MLRIQKKEMEKGRIKTFAYDGFSLFDKKDGRLTAVESLACACVDGVLRAGIGCGFYLLDGEAVKLGMTEEETVWVYLVEFTRSEEQLETVKQTYCHGTDGTLYLCDGAGDTYRIAELGERVGFTMATNRDMDMRAVFVGEGGICEAWPNGFSSRSELTDLLPVVCSCKNRIFLVRKPNKLMYSAAGDPWDFESTIDGGGSLRLPTESGEVVALVNLEDVVYIFFERGIARLQADAAARNFKIEPVAYGGDIIFWGSVGAFGKSIVFLAADGVYRFDGNKAVKAYEKLGIKPKREGQVCAHAVCADQYLLGYTDENRGEKTLVLHTDGEHGYFSYRLIGLTECNRRALCNAEGFLAFVKEDGEAFDGRYFDCGTFDFGSKERKTIRKLRFTGEGVASCSLYNGSAVRTKTLDFSDGVVEWKLRERGKEFHVKLALADGAKIRSMTAEVEML